jgi:hypothetical protein
MVPGVIGRLLGHVYVEVFQLYALFQQPIPQQGQVFEQHGSRHLRIGLDLGRQHSLVDRNFQAKGSQFGRTEPQSQWSSPNLRSLDRASHALHEPGLLNSAEWFRFSLAVGSP